MSRKRVEMFERGRASAAGSLDHAASRLRRKASGAPGGERGAAVVGTVARGMESTAAYLKAHDAQGMKADVTDAVRRNPGRTLVGSLAAGFILGRLFRR